MKRCDKPSNSRAPADRSNWPGRHDPKGPINPPSLDIRPIALVRLLDRLEAGGFVERITDPDDRRAHVLALTAKALPIIERIHELNRKTCNDLHLGISEAEATQLRVLLSRIRSELTAARLNDDPPTRPEAPAARSRELADCDDRRAGDLAKGGKEPA
jgi:hypothetical protein